MAKFDDEQMAQLDSAFITKKDLTALVTKDDLATLATKDDLQPLITRRQLQQILEGERFQTEQLIKKHTRPILDTVTQIEKVQLEDRRDAREDVDAVVTQYVDLQRRMKRIEKVHALEPTAR